MKRSSFNHLLTFSVSASILLAAGPGWAATASQSLTVGLQVQSGCVVLTPSDLNFGTASSLSTALTTTTSLSITCPLLTLYAVGLGPGTYPGATATTRRMTSGASSVSYQLYRNAAMTQVWGDTIGTNTTTALSLGLTNTYTVYGRVPVQTTPAGGNYADTVAVTVTY